MLNGEITEGGRWLKNGDVITHVKIEIHPPKSYHLKLNIIFEDEYLAVIEKPAGISVSGNQFKTIQNALLFTIKPSNNSDALPWPLPVHRLDNQTSGLLIIAKTKTTRVKLGQAFEQKKIQKTYNAIVIGKTKDQGVIESMIDDKKSISHYRKIVEYPSLKNEILTLLELNPLTGRTHQLRIHCAEMGHPILGDKLYGTPGLILKFKGLFLAALRLEFNHPITHEKLDFGLRIPSKFLNRLENEARRYNSYQK